MPFFFLNCAATGHYNFSFKNTLSIFLLNGEDGYFFAIPVQYIGNYQIESFEFNNGYIQIGDYKITLGRDDISIDVFVSESSDEDGNTDGLHNIVKSEKNGRILFSKMDVPLTKNRGNNAMFNQYNIFIENALKNGDMENIIKQYEQGNVYSAFYLEYTIAIDNELMPGCGLFDDFELYNGTVASEGFPPNMGFFITKVLQK
jgi:hypothetical protein